MKLNKGIALEVKNVLNTEWSFKYSRTHKIVEQETSKISCVFHVDNKHFKQLENPLILK